MLKDRREGLVYLYWCGLTIVAVAVYLGWVAFIRAWPSVHPVEGPNFPVSAWSGRCVLLGAYRRG